MSEDGVWASQAPGVQVDGPCEITFSIRPAVIGAEFVVRMRHGDTGETIDPVRQGADAPGGWGHVFRPATPGTWHIQVYGRPSSKAAADTSGVGE
jgi:hypothetical protein